MMYFFPFTSHRGLTRSIPTKLILQLRKSAYADLTLFYKYIIQIAKYSPAYQFVTILHLELLLTSFGVGISLIYECYSSDRGHNTLWTFALFP